MRRAITKASLAVVSLTAALGCSTADMSGVNASSKTAGHNASGDAQPNTQTNAAPSVTPPAETPADGATADTDQEAVSEDPSDTKAPAATQPATTNERHCRAAGYEASFAKTAQGSDLDLTASPGLLPGNTGYPYLTFTSPSCAGQMGSCAFSAASYFSAGNTGYDSAQDVFNQVVIGVTKDNPHYIVRVAVIRQIPGKGAVYDYDHTSVFNPDGTTSVTTCSLPSGGDYFCVNLASLLPTAALASLLVPNAEEAVNVQFYPSNATGGDVSPSGCYVEYGVH